MFFLPESCDEKVVMLYPQFPSVGKTEVGAAMFYLAAPHPSGCPSQGRRTLAFLTDVSGNNEMSLLQHYTTTSVQI